MMNVNQKKQQQQHGNVVSVSHLASEVDHVTEELRKLKSELCEIENSQNIVHPNDLHPIRLKLGQLSSRSFHGKFDIGGKLFDLTHTVVGDLVDECHELVSRYLTNSDYYKVDKALRPIHDRLTHICYALRELKDNPTLFNNLTPGDLLPYRRALGDLDGIYHDGAFDVSKDPTDKFPKYPHGEAIVVELFNEAYDLIDQLKMSTDFYKFNGQLRPIYDSLQTVIVALEGHNMLPGANDQPAAVKSKKMKKQTVLQGLKLKITKLFDKFKDIVNSKEFSLNDCGSMGATANLFDKAWDLMNNPPPPEQQQQQQQQQVGGPH
jgi:hypothetical protein